MKHDDPSRPGDSMTRLDLETTDRGEAEAFLNELYSHEIDPPDPGQIFGPLFTANPIDTVAVARTRYAMQSTPCRNGHCGPVGADTGLEQWRDDRGRMSQERQDAARVAGERAARRAEELHERAGDLDVRRSATDEDVDRARDALRTAQERAAAAHRRAGEQHLSAAERHDQVADVLAAGGHLERAREHRHAAEQDREESARAERAAIADDP